MKFRCLIVIAVTCVFLGGIVTGSALAQYDTALGDADRLRDQTQSRDTLRDQDRLMDRDAILERLGDRAGYLLQRAEALQLRAYPSEETDTLSWTSCRWPDLRIGKWWYKVPPKPGREVDLFFEIENIGGRTARAPILWEVTCHDWGFWNPVLNRIAVSYSKSPLPPGRSRTIHIRFPMTRHTHNLRLMADPSDRLGPPDNPPFGQKAKLYGWVPLKDGHILEANEKNNSKWVCIKVFPVTPGEPTGIVIPVVNPYPGYAADVTIEMGEELPAPEILELGLPGEDAAPLALTNTEPAIQLVKPGQVISKIAFEPEDGEEEVVLLAKLANDARLDSPVEFKVLAMAMGPEDEPIYAEVTVVLEMKTNDVVVPE